MLNLLQLGSEYMAFISCIFKIFHILEEKKCFYIIFHFVNFYLSQHTSVWKDSLYLIFPISLQRGIHQKKIYILHLKWVNFVVRCDI